MNNTVVRVISASVALLIVGIMGVYLPSEWMPVFFYIIAYLLALESIGLLGIPYHYLLALVVLPMVWGVNSYLPEAVYLLLLSWAIRVVCMFLGKRLQPVVLSLLQLYDISVMVAATIGLYQMNHQLLILTVMTIIGIDSVGYFAGKAYGKHRIVPKISPNKSLEGYIGALLWVLVVSSILLIVNEIPILRLTLVMGMVYILAITGDLLVSYQKRILKVKDSGSLMPGHGGLLDRFDSWLFVIPFMLFIVK